MRQRTIEPRSPKSKPEPPEEVKRLLKETASRLRQLDVQGWYAEITRLYKLSLDHNLGLHSDDRNIIVIRNAGETTIGHIGGPTATFVVNVNMPDANIYAQFERWLEEVRKQIKSTVAKPGRHALNSEFDKNKFGTWQSIGIVQFVDLLAWRATLVPPEQKKHTKSVLGKWIGRNSSKDVNATERVLKKALASLLALGAQVEHELTQGQADRELIAARIATDIAR